VYDRVFRPVGLTSVGSNGGGESLTFRSVEVPLAEERSLTVYKATLKSWDTEYQGDAAGAVMRQIRKRHNDDTKREYAKYISVVQSSGMGKSRMIDEVSILKAIF
jgi:hypothetical protein